MAEVIGTMDLTGTKPVTMASLLLGEQPRMVLVMKMHGLLKQTNWEMNSGIGRLVDQTWIRDML